jgi:hypothetical protein
VIAVDYTYTFLDRELRQGLDAILTQWKLSLPQQEQARALRERIAALLVKIGQERTAAYGKVQSFAAVATHLEQLERQLRTSMPQHVIDLATVAAAAAGPLTSQALPCTKSTATATTTRSLACVNAVAAVVGANGYTGALAIAVTAGFITALLAYAFAPDRLNGWKWLAGVVLIYTVLLVPRVTVGIVDKLGNQPVKVVANVPLGLGLLGHFTNVVGNTLTELFETAFRVIPATRRCRWALVSAARADVRHPLVRKPAPSCRSATGQTWLRAQLHDVRSCR